MDPTGGTRPPRPEETVKIEADQLGIQDGHYVLRITEPMDEVMYLDHFRLVVIDHAPDRHVYPDERFAVADPQPTGELLVLGQPVFATRALDHQRNDVTDILRNRDNRQVDGFRHRAWLGYAEEHTLELDFGEQLQLFDPNQRLYLCLAGWTDYPFPEAIYAAEQAGVKLLPPVLEIERAGRWEVLDAEFGFPAGLPRVMLREVKGLCGVESCKLRLRTNMQIYWDQIAIAPGLGSLESPSPNLQASGTVLELAGATLAHPGMYREVRGADHDPVSYSTTEVEPVEVTAWQGTFTAPGDVTALLRARDDAFVLCRPGDAVTMRFDARALPPLPVGWKRSFALRSFGYCKGAGPFTVTGGTVEPMPHRGMPNYPYDPAQGPR
jgi:hypothetical protein